MPRLALRAENVLCLVLTLVLTLGLVAGTRLAAAADPAAFVQGVGDEVVAVLKSTEPHSTPRKERLRAIFTHVFDTRGIAEFVVGRHWQRLSEDERRQYLALFPAYVAAIYAGQFSDYRGQNFTVTGTRPGSGVESFVAGELSGGGIANPIELEFRVVQAGSVMKIRDVKVDGISMLVVKRDEFGSFLNREPPAKLRALMRKAVDG